MSVRCAIVCIVIQGSSSSPGQGDRRLRGTSTSSPPSADELNVTVNSSIMNSSVNNRTADWWKHIPNSWNNQVWWNNSWNMDWWNDSSDWSNTNGWWNNSWNMSWNNSWNMDWGNN